ncbi:hypothetical protein BJF79_39680 [Actinomadura sp. CNU-125]|uniref:hypothetical protein n=1 Tax=Actinomadura sp. CNU-125 TaxID=1904961 RepID=UPI00095F40D1|nr:hypothetical protein [Actinomadura sp. CNU-125]OLT30073.1 hypothetical protein BJF79_39680 [Actinomadura sp. CNU-125]
MTRLMVTPDMIARQFERLADWHVQLRDPHSKVAGDPAALTAGHRLAGGGHAAVFDVLCDVVDRIDDLDNDRYEYAADDDPDDIDRDVREAHEDALAPLVDAAALQVMGPVSFCTICQSYFLGRSCPNCGWSHHIEQDGAA